VREPSSPLAGVLVWLRPLSTDWRLAVWKCLSPTARTSSK